MLCPLKKKKKKKKEKKNKERVWGQTKVSCKVDQITSVEREWFIFLQLTDKLWFTTQQITHKSWSICIYMFVCLCWGFMAQSTQWGHVERGQFT